MELALVIDAALPEPLHQQVYSQLRWAILSGRLSSGQRLPASRVLAKSFGLSRTTVLQGYEQLISEGYLQARPGAGTYVCTQLPELLLEAEPAKPPPQPAVEIPLSAYGKRVNQLSLTSFKESFEISFRYGHPAIDLFPVGLWRKLLSKHCRETTQWLKYSENSLGHWPLRKAVAGYLQQSRAVRCAPEQVIITNGSQQALNLIVQLLINSTDSVAIEEPGYRGARHIFKASGATLLPMPLDQHGLIVDRLVRHDETPRLIYVTPSHQFPTGALLSLPRRLALLQWAWKTGALVVEDDYDSEYRYSGRPIPSLQGLDSHSSVLYVGTFSKVMFPGIRLGYLVVPKSLVETFSQAKWLADRQPPTLTQYALTEFITAGYLERHIRKMRMHYERRRNTLVQALYRDFGNDVTILGDSAGLHVMAKLPINLNDDEVIARAASVGVEMCSARIQYEEPCNMGEFVFGYTDINETEIEQGIHRVAKALRI